MIGRLGSEYLTVDEGTLFFFHLFLVAVTPKI